MGITLAYTSALHALRLRRSEGEDPKSLNAVPLSNPRPTYAKRWTVREFAPDVWCWQRVNANNPLHVLVGEQRGRIRMQGVKCHLSAHGLPAGSILPLDERTSMVAPPLLFLQMARELSLPELVLLGYELCGHYALSANDPQGGPMTDNLPTATSVEELAAYLDMVGKAWRVTQAREALAYVQDHAASPMEGILGTMYSLPTKELGYGMGPVTLNPRVWLGDDDDARSRFPDLMFPFAPIGINYDGGGHLDLDGLVRCALRVGELTGDERAKAMLALEAKRDAVRQKVVDDAARNRELATTGRIVLPMTKENLYGEDELDTFTRDLLKVAHACCGVDVAEYEKALNDSDLCKDRFQLLSSMLPRG